VIDIAQSLDHKLVVVKDYKSKTNRKHRENIRFRKNPEYLESMLMHYIELGYRANEAGKTLGQVVRESRQLLKKPKGTDMNTPKTLNIIIEQVKGYWHFFSDGWTDKIRTPYPEQSARSEVVAYITRAFPGAKIVEMGE
jgi:hypothetical protein